MATNQKGLEVFCCFDSNDGNLLAELRAHLIPLQHEGLIRLWANVDIGAGEEWQKEIDRHLNSAPIILLLVSPDFMASEYAYSKEMKQALKRHEDNDALVIPVILRPTDWHNAPFGKLQSLPKNGMPVTGSAWHTRDEAFLNVAAGVRKAVKDRRSAEDLQREAEREAEEERIRREDAARRRRMEELALLQAEDERRRRLEEEERRRKLEEEERRRRLEEEEVQKKQKDEEQKRLALEENIAEERRKLTESKSYKYVKFRREGPHAGVFAVGSAYLFLLGGVGALCGIWTENLIVAVAGVAVMGGVGYLLGYRKALSPIGIGIIALVSAVLVWWITARVVGVRYDATLIHQLIYGACIGGLCSLWMFSVMADKGDTPDSAELTFLGVLLFCIPGAIIAWAIGSLLGIIFKWGFGYGYGWDFSLFGGALVTVCTGIGVIFSIYLWQKSRKFVFSFKPEDLDINVKAKAAERKRAEEEKRLATKK